MSAVSSETFVSSMSRDVLEDCLAVLFQENKANLESGASANAEHWFKSDLSAEFVLAISSKLSLTYEARYLALETFDRFMKQHVRELHEHVRRSSSVDRPAEEWESVLGRVRKQIPLRVVSCCRLAAQMVDSCQAVSTSKISSLLAACGYKYSVQSIVQSELRVLKTLKYRLMVSTPLVYVETLLAVLDHNDKSLRATSHYATCIDLLDVVYLRRTRVYGQLADVIADKHEAPDHTPAQVLPEDKMLLAAAVVSAASYLLDQSRSDRMLENLSRVTKIPDDDILDLATILIQQVLQGNEH